MLVKRQCLSVLCRSLWVLAWTLVVVIAGIGDASQSPSCPERAPTSALFLINQVFEFVVCIESGHQMML